MCRGGAATSDQLLQWQFERLRHVHRHHPLPRDDDFGMVEAVYIAEDDASPVVGDILDLPERPAKDLNAPGSIGRRSAGACNDPIPRFAPCR